MGGMLGEQLGHRGRAQPPMAARDLAEQLRARPLRVAPHAVHHPPAMRERLEVGRPELLALAALEAHEPAARLRTHAMHMPYT